jgi:hypothetical protein
MKIIGTNKFEIGTWDYPNPEEKEFIWFEYLTGCCGCKFLTICDILFIYYDKRCVCSTCEKRECECKDDLSID